MQSDELRLNTFFVQLLADQPQLLESESIGCFGADFLTPKVRIHNLGKSDGISGAKHFIYLYTFCGAIVFKKFNYTRQSPLNTK